jgi:hypothetical protein
MQSSLDPEDRKAAEALLKRLAELQKQQQAGPRLDPSQAEQALAELAKRQQELEERTTEAAGNDPAAAKVQQMVPKALEALDAAKLAQAARAIDELAKAQEAARREALGNAAAEVADPAAGEQRKQVQDLADQMQAVKRAFAANRDDMTPQVKNALEKVSRTLATQATKLAETMEAPKGSDGAKAKSALEEAAAQQQRAAAAMAKGDMQGAEEAQTEAGLAAQDARLALGDREGAEEQSMLRQRTAAVRDAMQQLAEAGQDGPRAQELAEAAKEMRNAVGPMSGAEEALRDGQAGKAAKAQKQALDNLQRAREALGRAGAQAGDEAAAGLEQMAKEARAAAAQAAQEGSPDAKQAAEGLAEAAAATAEALKAEAAGESDKAADARAKAEAAVGKLGEALSKMDPSPSGGLSGEQAWRRTHRGPSSRPRKARPTRPPRRRT